VDGRIVPESLWKNDPAGADARNARSLRLTLSAGVRPTAVELFREGYNPRALRSAFGSWFGFVRSQSGLAPEEQSAYDAIRPFLEALETTEMSKSYKMLVMLAILNGGQIPGVITLADSC